MGLLLLAFAAAMHSTSLASAFAPPLPLSMSFPATTSVCGRRKYLIELMAKKRRKKSAPSEERGGVDTIKYRRTAKISSNKKIVGGTDEEDDAGETETAPKQTTLSGGSSLIFEMARRMLVWDDELYDSQIINDAGSRDSISSSSPSAEYLNALPSTSVRSPMSSAESKPLPRWRPSAIGQQSISDVNPSFRTSAPVMTNAGYAGILRRNSRKKNKPSMWRHTLRVYDKMAELESEAVGRKKVRRSAAHHEAALVAASKLGLWEEALRVYRGVEESSTSYRSDDAQRGRSRVTDNMLLSVVSACVKGSRVKWTAASSSDFDPTPAAVDADSDDTTKNDNDAMNLINATKSDNATESIIAAYDSPYRSSSRPMLRELTVEERRQPLDNARDIILSMEEKHDIPLVSRHINQLASAYVRLGLCSEAASLINDNLKDRAPPPPSTKQRSSHPKKSKQWKEKREPIISDNPGFEGVKLVDWSDDDLDDDDDGYEEGHLNIHQMKAKDRASYSLLVKGAAMEEDWIGAVRALQRMTDAGLHPNTRNLNSWSEVMERGCRPAGNGNENASDDEADYYYGGRHRRKSWKKKRDRIWLGNLR